MHSAAISPWSFSSSHFTSEGLRPSLFAKSNPYAVGCSESRVSIMSLTVREESGFLPDRLSANVTPDVFRSVTSIQWRTCTGDPDCSSLTVSLLLYWIVLCLLLN